jgi:hypothetical protein
MNENPPLEVPVSNRMALCSAAARAIDQLNNADPEVVIVNPIGAIRMSSGRKYSLRLVAMDEERVQEVTLGPRTPTTEEPPVAPAVALWNKVIERATGNLKENAKWGRPKELLDEDDKLHLVVEFPIESGPEEHMRRLQGPLQQILNEVTVKRATLTHVRPRPPVPASFVQVERKQHICGHFEHARELVRRTLHLPVHHGLLPGGSVPKPSGAPDQRIEESASRDQSESHRETPQRGGDSTFRPQDRGEILPTIGP